MNSRGFSLVEVMVGVAIVAIAAVSLGEISTQLAGVHAQFSARSRLEASVDSMLADAHALLRYDGPAADALRGGALPPTFTIYQWEPDMSRAPVHCEAARISEPLEHIHFSCRDRHGISVTQDLALNSSQPFPGSVVTASPSPL